MQFIKSVLLSTAVVASIASAAPVVQEERMVVDQPFVFPNGANGGVQMGHGPLSKILPRDDSEVVEKRLSWGKVAIGAASAAIGWLTSKEGQEFLTTDEGKAFVSKLAANDESLSKREPLNVAATIGLTAGSVLKGIFGSKEAADEFLATDEGKEFISKLSANDQSSRRDISVPEKRLSWGKVAAGAAAAAVGWFTTKEGQDFLASDEGKAFVSKMAANDESLSKREPLNAAAAIGLTAGSVLKGIFGSKEAADEFLATDEGKEFVSKLSANDESLSKRAPLNAAATIGLTAGSVLKGIFGSKEAADKFLASDAGKEFVSSLNRRKDTEDLQARGKADYGSLAAAIINAFNAIRSRDVASGDADFDLLG